MVEILIHFTNTSFNYRRNIDEQILLLKITFQSNQELFYYQKKFNWPQMCLTQEFYIDDTEKKTPTKPACCQARLSQLLIYHRSSLAPKATIYKKLKKNTQEFLGNCLVTAW